MGVMPDVQLLSHPEQSESRIIYLPQQAAQAMPGQPRQIDLLLDAYQSARLIVQQAQSELIFSIAQIARHVRVMQQVALIHGEGLLMANQYPPIRPTFGRNGGSEPGKL